MKTTNAGAIQPALDALTPRHNEMNEPADQISEDGRIVSETEYWAEYYDHPDFSYEWNNGRLEEKPVSD